MRSKQLSFLPMASASHGGETRLNKRKIARPVDPRRPMHVVLRASIARGERSMLHPKKRLHVDARVKALGEKHGVRLLRYANVGNHLHLLVLGPSRRGFQAFLREITGAVAMIMTGSRKGIAGRFWDGLAFTRIVSWGRDLDGVQLYFIKNLFEAAGFLNREAKARGMKVVQLFGWRRPVS